jgi:hypothetical protein
MLGAIVLTICLASLPDIYARSVADLKRGLNSRPASQVQTHAPDMFKDVVQPHWAYDATAQLASNNWAWFYPRGYLGRKRTMTRFEFAVVIDRTLCRLADFATVNQTKAPRNARVGFQLAMSADDADLFIRLLMEFRDEVAAIGGAIPANLTLVKLLDVWHRAVTREAKTGRSPSRIVVPARGQERVRREGPKPERSRYIRPYVEPYRLFVPSDKGDVSLYLDGKPTYFRIRPVSVLFQSFAPLSSKYGVRVDLAPPPR